MMPGSMFGIMLAKHNYMMVLFLLFPLQHTDILYRYKIDNKTIKKEAK